MIARLLQAIQTVTLIFALIGGIYVTYQGYRIYSAISSRIQQIDSWIDRFRGNEKRWLNFESRLDRLEAFRERRENSGMPSAPQKPTVILYSIEGCTPCEQWWMKESPKWIASGWDVKRELSTTSQPTPYWDVWDGDKWIHVSGNLNIDSYKKAGGK